MDKRTGKKSKAIKQPEYNKGSTGFVLSSADAPNIDYPVFSLRHLMNGYTLGECDKKLKSAFATKLYSMAQQTWSALESTDHKSGGFERLPKERFKVSMPNIVTEDVSKLHVMRFNGKTGRIIGLRSDHIFHITHIEINKSAYNHGS